MSQIKHLGKRDGIAAMPKVGRGKRELVFDMATTDKLLLTGMHLHFPGFSHLVRSGSGYRLIPAAWEHVI